MAAEKTEREIISPRSGLATYLLCLFFGELGLHRFYTRNFWTGFLMLLTFGFCGAGILYDLYYIVTDKFEDGKKQRVKFRNEQGGWPMIALAITGLATAAFIFAFYYIGGTVAIEINFIVILAAGVGIAIYELALPKLARYIDNATQTTSDMNTQPSTTVKTANALEIRITPPSQAAAANKSELAKTPSGRRPHSARPSTSKNSKSDSPLTDTSPIYSIRADSIHTNSGMTTP